MFHSTKVGLNTCEKVIEGRDDGRVYGGELKMNRRIQVQVSAGGKPHLKGLLSYHLEVALPLKVCMENVYLLMKEGIMGGEDPA